MIQAFINSFKSALYIKIENDHIEVTDLYSGKKTNKPGQGAFNHSRSLIKDFELAVSILKPCVDELVKTKFIRPRVFFHWLPELEGGLTQIESQVFLELGQKIGAREVYSFTSSSTIHPSSFKDLLNSKRSFHRGL